MGLHIFIPATQVGIRRDIGLVYAIDNLVVTCIAVRLVENETLHGLYGNRVAKCHAQGINLLLRQFARAGMFRHLRDPVIQLLVVRDLGTPLADQLLDILDVLFHRCPAPCDYISRRSYPLCLAREVLATTLFDAAQSLEDTLSRYVRLYNHQIPQRALGHIAPVQALQDWQEKCPRLFKK